MARITNAEVRAILPASTTLTDAQIDAAIAAATLVVDRLATSYCGDGLLATELSQIETYLAAHMCANTENTLSLQSETDACTGASARYGFRFGKGVLGTPFGQTANLISNGCLQERDKTPAGIIVLGADNELA